MSTERQHQGHDKYIALIISMADLVGGTTVRGLPPSHTHRHTRKLNFSWFHAVFKKLFQNYYMLAPPSTGLVPSSTENIGSAPYLNFWGTQITCYYVFIDQRVQPLSRTKLLCHWWLNFTKSGCSEKNVIFLCNEFDGKIYENHPFPLHPFFCNYSPLYCNLVRLYFL